MRRLQCTFIILVLALVGCAGESEPDPSPATGSPRVARPLTSAEVTAYQAELGQLFAQRDALAQRHSSTSGATVELEGHASVALVKVDAEGQLVTTCVDSEQDAIQFLTSSAPEAR
jgi:hypothetical protein